MNLLNARTGLTEASALKASRPYLFKRKLSDPFPQVGVSGEALQLDAWQPHDDWYAVRATDTQVHEPGEFYVQRHSLEHDFDYEHEKSPWLDERTRKNVRKNRKNTIAVLEKVKEKFGTEKRCGSSFNRKTKCVWLGEAIRTYFDAAPPPAPTGFMKVFSSIKKFFGVPTEEPHRSSMIHAKQYTLGMLLLKEAKVQADMDTVNETLQAVTNCGVQNFGQFSTRKHIVSALGRSITWLKEME